MHGFTADRAHGNRCISQDHSHRPMNATKEVFRELLMMHEVSEEILEIAAGFHWKDITTEEALGYPFWKRLSKDRDRLGTCHNAISNTGVCLSR